MVLWCRLLLNILLHCRCKELGRLRGKLFGNKFDHQRYLTLVNIGLSPEEQKHEEDMIHKCIQDRQALSKHLQCTPELIQVPLAHGTHCLVYLRHGRKQE